MCCPEFYRTFLFVHVAFISPLSTFVAVLGICFTKLRQSRLLLAQTCMALVLSNLLAKNYGRLCRKKSKSPKHWRSSKKILRPYLFIAAANYAKVLL